jgi:hypothetical protein
VTVQERNDACQDRYHTLKGAGLCPHCKGDPKPGRVYCARYLIATWQSARLNPERREYMRRYQVKYARRRRRRWRRMGLCTKCGRLRNPRCSQCGGFRRKAGIRV